MPTNKDNKVRFNLKNVHYAVETEAADGTVTYGTPVAWPGAKNLTMDAEGDNVDFYADGVKYYVSYANNGYSGSLEMALTPDSFRKDVLGETQDEKGVLAENANAESKAFTLLFQFDGDERSTRHAIYHCKARRPSVSGATTEGSKEPQTETIDITSVPGADGITKAKTTADVDETTYNNWFTSVYVPGAENGGGEP